MAVVVTDAAEGLDRVRVTNIESGASETVSRASEPIREAIERVGEK